MHTDPQLQISRSFRGNDRTKRKSSNGRKSDVAKKIINHRVVTVVNLDNCPQHPSILFCACCSDPLGSWTVSRQQPAAAPSNTIRWACSTTYHYSMRAGFVSRTSRLQAAAGHVAPKSRSKFLFWFLEDEKKDSAKTRNSNVTARKNKTRRISSSRIHERQTQK